MYKNKWTEIIMVLDYWYKKDKAKMSKENKRTWKIIEQQMILKIREWFNLEL